jgi:hypothetical protein
VLPYISLAQVNRQIRAEYLPICMQAQVTIAWRDLPNYINTFYPTAKGQLKNLEQAPSAITIIADYDKKDGDNVVIDVLPLIKMRHAHATFQCHFVHLISDDGLQPKLVDDEVEARPYWLTADSEMIASLINHTHVRWLHDVSTGRVEKILVDFLGTSVEPTAQFHVHTHEVPESLEGVRWTEADVDGEAMDQYLGAMGLQDVRSTCIGLEIYNMQTAYFVVDLS